MAIFKFTATTILNAFILNSILISFSVVFLTTLKSYEKSLNHRTMLYILDGLTSGFLLLMWAYYSATKNNEDPNAVMLIIGVFLIANITLTILDVKGINLGDKNESSDDNSNNKSSALDVYILFLTTFFATLFIYYVMHGVFGFGGGMLANESYTNA